MRKRRKHNKEDEVFNMKYVLEINHKIDMLKRLWSLFTQNKEWVLSLLFVSSIIHSILLYGLFGINILEFYSLTDIFVNFAEVFVPFLIMIPLGVLLYLFPDGESKCSSSIGLAIKIVLFVFAAIILSLIFHNYFGVPFLIYFIALIGLIYKKGKLLAWNVIVLFLLFSLGLPIEKRMMYKGNTPLVDRLSFTLSESTKTYDLSDIDRYFYIGGSVDYFFLYDKSKDSVEIIPKNECGNISRTPFYWEDLWKSETHINSSQKVRKRQDFKH
jgi:hypothetical protein